MLFLSEIFGQKTHDSIKILSSEEFRDRVSGRKSQLVDVRTPREFHGGHLENAININYNSNAFETLFPEESIEQIVDFIFDNDIEQPEWFEAHFQGNGGMKRGKKMRRNRY